MCGLVPCGHSASYEVCFLSNDTRLHDFLCVLYACGGCRSQGALGPWSWSYRSYEPSGVCALNHWLISPTPPTKPFALSGLLILQGDAQGKRVGETLVPTKTWKWRAENTEG